MPFFIVTDNRFPPPWSNAHARLKRNIGDIKDSANGTTLEIVVVDEVDAGSLKWRLFESAAAPIPRLPFTEIQLILVEHIWPLQFVASRDTWQRKIIQSIISAFPHSFVVAVGRHAEIQEACQGLTISRARSRWLRPVHPHYKPLRMDYMDPVGIPINDGNNSSAFVVCPKTQRCTLGTWGASTLAPWTWENLLVHNIAVRHRLDIPDIVQRVVQHGGSVIQCGCFTAESTRAIFEHLRNTGAITPLPPVIPPPPARPPPIPCN